MKGGEENEKISMGLAFPVNHHCRFYLGDSFNSKMDMGNKSAGMVKSVINSQLKRDIRGQEGQVRRHG